MNKSLIFQQYLNLSRDHKLEMPLTEELKAENEQLRGQFEANNGVLEQFAQLKPCVLEYQGVYQRLKRNLKNGESELVAYLRQQKISLIERIYGIKGEIREMYKNIDCPPASTCEALLQESEALSAYLQQAHTAADKGTQIPRYSYTPEDRFILLHQAVHRRTDSTLPDPRRIATFIKGTCEAFSCLNDMQTHFWVLYSNTLRNPTFLMAFGVLPEIAKAHTKYTPQITNYFISKWCLRFERTLCGWLENLPQIEPLKDYERSLDYRWFAADEREFSCGKVANFMLTALALQGWEIVADVGGIGIRCYEQVIYV